MKIKRNYRFVLTVVNKENLTEIKDSEIIGDRLFMSECHYYAEKNIIEILKNADKAGEINKYYNFIYCIYKEEKPKKDVNEYEKDGKKVIEISEIKGAAQLIEVIKIDEEGVSIQ